MTSFVVSGASGTIGIPLISCLLQRSHGETTIYAVCRNERGAAVVDRRYPVSEVQPSLWTCAIETRHRLSANGCQLSNPASAFTVLLMCLGTSPTSNLSRSM